MSWIDLDTTAPVASEWRDVALWKPSSRLEELGRSLAARLGCYAKKVEGDPAAWVASNRPEILLADDTCENLALLAPLAQSWRTGLASCFEIDLDVARRLLVLKTHAFGGRMVVEYVCPEARPQIALLK